ncbi:hypothetical protein K435DRAFT_916151 [Dendrothele bispora CBS 962.96]|uniref:Uncharacterized protein n=1 Tax=Dendrothele bispora (strain CBS 962.96) TaxID=1314807 RepID=A0A4S8MKA9_DENBC|nr:hypothetical protein K435DRAFT_916151 [Dendrothele bispora CBS 962.96]
MLGCGITNEEDRAMLVEFAQVKDIQRAFSFVMAKLTAVERRLINVEPSPETYQIPDGLKGHIETTTLQIFFSPTLGAYLKDQWPNKKVVAVLKKNPQWGLTPAVSGDKLKMKIINKKISSRFIHHRNDAKDIISTSLGKFDEATSKFDNSGTGIIDLSEQLIRTVGGRSFDLRVTVPLCARIAFIRSVYRTAFKAAGNVKPPDFWGKLDEELQKVCNEKEGNADRISRQSHEQSPRKRPKPIWATSC